MNITFEDQKKKKTNKNVKTVSGRSKESHTTEDWTGSYREKI